MLYQFPKNFTSLDCNGKHFFYSCVRELEDKDLKTLKLQYPEVFNKLISLSKSKNVVKAKDDDEQEIESENSDNQLEVFERYTSFNSEQDEDKEVEDE